LLGRGEQRQGGRDLRIADAKQGGRPRRFEDYLGAATSHVRKAREDENVAVAERALLRPVICDLRLDDHLILAIRGRAQAVLHQALPGETPHQKIDFLVDRPRAGQ
jgi:hypothetical protein